MSEVYDRLIDQVEDEDAPLSRDSREVIADALAFVVGLHQMFRENGMTASQDPELGELENLVDALAGELGAATLYLTGVNGLAGYEGKVVQELTHIANQITVEDAEAKTVPTVVRKGFARLAARVARGSKATHPPPEHEGEAQ